jgi:hypothetical protein
MEDTEVVSRVIATASGAMQRRGKKRIVKEWAGGQRENPVCGTSSQIMNVGAPDTGVQWMRIEL